MQLVRKFDKTQKGHAPIPKDARRIYLKLQGILRVREGSGGTSFAVITGMVRNLVLFLLLIAPSMGYPRLPEPTTSAAPLCTTLLSHHEGSGVEIEINLTDNILEKLAHPAPQWSTQPTPAARREFLRQEVAKNIKQKKVYSGEIAGLTLKESVFSEIHNRSAEDARHMRGIELHRSTEELAGQNLRTSLAALKAEGLDQSNAGLHTHLIFPYEKIKNKYGADAAILLTEFFKRANLFAEIISRMDGLLISEVSTQVTSGQKQNLFGFLTRDKISDVYEYLKGDTAKPTESSEQKMCYVGFRPQGRYRNKQLMGFEYRALSFQHSSFSLISLTLDQIHARLLQGDLFEKPEQITKWAAQLASRGRNIADTWYNPGDYNRDILKAAPPAVQELLRQDSQEKILSALFTLAEKDAAVLMLLYDWGMDSMFFKRPEQAEKVLAAQLEALRLLGQHPERSRQILTKFFLHSGIFKATVMP